MPDVRHGCAAQSSALTRSRHRRSFSRASTARAPRLYFHGARHSRSHLARRSNRSSACVVTPSSFKPTACFHHRCRLAHFGSPAPRAVATIASGSPGRCGSTYLTHCFDPRAQSILVLNRSSCSIVPRAPSKRVPTLAMPSFTPLATSGSTAPHQRTGRAAHGPPAFFGHPGLPQPAPLPLGRA